MTQRWWDTQNVLAQLRLRLLKEDGTARLRQILAEASFAGQLQATLEAASTLPSQEEAHQHVRIWLQQQQALRHNAFPATRLWNLMRSLLEPSSSPSPTGLPATPDTPGLRSAAPPHATPLPRMPHTPLPRPSHTPLPRTPHTPLPRTPHTPPRTPLPRPPVSGMSQPSLPQPPAPSRTPLPRRPAPGVSQPSLPQHPSHHPLSTPSGRPTPNTSTPLPRREPSEAPSPTPPGAASTGEESNTSRRKDPRRGLPSAPPLSGMRGAVGAQVESSASAFLPHWDAEAILSQLRFGLLRDRSASSLRHVVQDERVAQEMLCALEEAATLPTEHTAHTHLQQWLHRYQSQSRQAFPAQRLWNLLLPLLNEAAAASESSSAPSVSSSALSSSAQPSARPSASSPVLPYSKRSRKARRSSQSLEAASALPLWETEPTSSSPAIPQTPTSAQAPAPPQTPASARASALPQAPVSAQASAFSSEVSSSPPSPPEAAYSLEFSLEEDMKEVLTTLGEPRQEPTKDASTHVLAPTSEAPREPLSQQISTWFRTQLDEMTPGRWLLLVVVVLLGGAVITGYNPFERRGPQGDVLNARPYRQHIPVQSVYADRKARVFAVVMQPNWKSKLPAHRLLRYFLLQQNELGAQGFRRIKVFSHRHEKLYEISVSLE